jgi:hypothetical protein
LHGQRRPSSIQGTDEEARTSYQDKPVPSGGTEDSAMREDAELLQRIFDACCCEGLETVSGHDWKVSRSHFLLTNDSSYRNSS